MRKLYLPNTETEGALIEHNVYCNPSDAYRYINKLSIAKGSKVSAVLLTPQKGRIYKEVNCSKNSDRCPGIINHSFVTFTDTPSEMVYTNEPQIITDFVDCVETEYPSLAKWDESLVGYLLKGYGEWSKKNEEKSFEEFLASRYSKIYQTMSFNPLEKYAELSEEINDFLKLFYLEKEREVTFQSLEEVALREYKKVKNKLPYNFREETLLERINNEFNQNTALAKSNEKVLALRNQTK